MFDYLRAKSMDMCSTSNWRADQIGDAVQEVDHTESRGQEGGAHNIGGHDWDQSHIGAIEIPVEHSPGDEEGVGVEEGDEDTAEALHAYCYQVAQ